MKQLVKFLINAVPRPYLIWWSNFFRPILDIYFRGTKFIDPINSKSYRKFLPYGYVRQRENALSPGTLSLERHRLLWLFLKNETIFFKKKIRLLHIAPFFEGSTAIRRNKVFTQLGYEVTTIDLDKYIKFWKRGLISVSRKLPISLFNIKLNQQVIFQTKLHEFDYIICEKPKFLLCSSIYME